MTRPAQPRLDCTLFPSRVVLIFVSFAFCAWNLKNLRAPAPPHSGFTLPIVLWLGSIGLYFWAMGVASRRPGRQNAGKVPWKSLLIAGVLFALALIPRIWRLGTLPSILGGDEANFGLEIDRIFRGELRNPFTTGWFSHPMLSFYHQSWGVCLLGRNITALRLPSALAGALTVPVVWWLGRQSAGRTVGLMGAFLIAAYHLHLHYSRVAMNNILDPLLGATVVALLLHARARNETGSWALAGAATGLSFYGYFGSRLLPIIVVLCLVGWASIEGKAFLRRAGLGLPILLGGFLLVAAPMLQDAILHPDDFMARLRQVGLIHGGWFMKSIQGGGANPIELLWDQFRRSVLAFNLFPDRTTNYGLPKPWLDPFFGTLFLVGLGYATLGVFARRRLLPLAVWYWCGVFFGGMLTDSPPMSSRLVSLSVPVCVMIALASERILQLARRGWPAIPTRFLLVALTLSFAVLSVKTYFSDFLPLGIYGGDHAALAQETSDAIEHCGPNYRVYLFGPPLMYAGFPTMAYLTPQGSVVDVLEPLAQPPATGRFDVANGALFVFLPQRLHELRYVNAVYRHGRAVIVRHRDNGRAIGTFYFVDASTGGPTRHEPINGK